MLVLVLTDVHYSEKALFCFEKGSNCQNHSFSGPLHGVKNSPAVNFFFPTKKPPPLPSNPSLKTAILHVKLLISENLVGGSTPPPPSPPSQAERGRGVHTMVTH